MLLNNWCFYGPTKIYNESHSPSDYRRCGLEKMSLSGKFKVSPFLQPSIENINSWTCSNIVFYFHTFQILLKYEFNVIF